MEYLNSIIKESGYEIDVYSVKEIDPSILPDAELYIFSSPTHLGYPSGKMKGFIKNINNKEGKKYTTVTTCMAPDKTQAIETMEKMLNEKGMKKATKSVKIKVESLKGPAEEHSKEQLKDLAKEIKQKIG